MKLALLRHFDYSLLSILSRLCPVLVSITRFYQLWKDGDYTTQPHYVLSVHLGIQGSVIFCHP